MYLNHPFDVASLSQLIGLHKLALAPKGVKTMEKNDLFRGPQSDIFLDVPVFFK